MRYWPVPSVTAVRIFSISAGLAASTLTPGSTPPDTSFTTPAMTACANAAVGRSTTTANKRRILTATRMLTPRFVSVFTAALYTRREAFTPYFFGLLRGLRRRNQSSVEHERHQLR